MQIVDEPTKKEENKRKTILMKFNLMKMNSFIYSLDRAEQLIKVFIAHRSKSNRRWKETKKTHQIEMNEFKWNFHLTWQIKKPLWNSL